MNKLSECRTLERSSRDPRRVDTHGRCLLELCKATGLLILDCRIGHGKGIGACTRINETSATLVDYVIASPGLFPSVNEFRINRKFPESDHLPISFSIESNKPVESIDNKDMSGWKPHIKYIWSECDLDHLGTALQGEHSDKYRGRLKASLAELCDTNTVALVAEELISQAADRVFTVSRGKRPRNSAGPHWYDTECRTMRSIAVKAGERVSTQEDMDNLADKCRQYRACKQMKKEGFEMNDLEQLRTHATEIHQNSGTLSINFPTIYISK